MLLHILQSALMLMLICITSSAKGAEFVDMAHPYSSHVFAWPMKGSMEGFWIKQMWKIPVANSKTAIFQGKQFWAQEHAGTHMDAPYHFFESLWTVEQIPSERLIGVPAVVVDITSKASKKLDATVDEEDLIAWEKKNGRIPDGSVVMMNSGWGKLYSNFTKYVGAAGTDASKFHFPSFGPTGAKWLTANRKAIGIAVDTASADTPVSENFPVHIELLKNKYYLLENVANIDKLRTGKGWQLNILPIKLTDGTGGPARIIAKKV